MKFQYDNTSILHDCRVDVIPNDNAILFITVARENGTGGDVYKIHLNADDVSFLIQKLSEVSNG